MTTTGTPTTGISTTKLAIGVMLGILAAALVVFVLVQLNTPRDCALQQLEVETGQRADYDLDDACR